MLGNTAQRNAPYVRSSHAQGSLNPVSAKSVRQKHSDFRPRPRLQYGYGPQKTVRYAPRISRLTFFLISISSATIFTIIGFLVLSSRAPLPSIVDRGLPDIRITAGYPLSREDLIAKLEINQRRELGSMVHFISQIVAQRVGSLSKAKELAKSIVIESKIANVDPLFVTAVIKSESGFRNTARSPVGALGLMQIMPATGKFITKISENSWFGTHKLLETDYNIRMGITYLKYLDKLFEGNQRHMLYAYNWGPAAWRDAMQRGSTPPGVTSKYARTILADFAAWKETYNQKKDQYKFFSHRYLDDATL